MSLYIHYDVANFEGILYVILFLYLNIRLKVILVLESDSTVHCYLKVFVIQSDHKTFSRVMLCMALIPLATTSNRYYINYNELMEFNCNHSSRASLCNSRTNRVELRRCSCF